VGGVTQDQGFRLGYPPARNCERRAVTFADGRQRRTPCRSGHAQKEAQSQAAKQAGEDISSFFFGNYLSACDLSAALGRVFSAVAQGHLKPKAATALAYLGQTLNQSVKIA